MVNAHQGGGDSKSDPSVRTVFWENLPEDLKPMLEGAKVGRVRKVAQNWLDVHELLVGKDGKGGIKKDFDNAIDKVLKEWSGDAADKFYTRAKKISLNLANGAPYAKATGDALEVVADKLQEAINDFGDINWDPASRPGQAQSEKLIVDMIRSGGGHISGEALADEQIVHVLGGNIYGKTESWNRVIADLESGMTADAVFKKYENESGTYGLPTFARQILMASSAMDKLAATYTTTTKEMEPPEPSEDGDVPPRKPTGPGDRKAMDVGGGPGLDVGGGSGANVGDLGDMKTGPNNVTGVDGGPHKSSMPSLTIDPPPGSGTKPGSQVGTGLEGISGTGGGGVGVSGGPGAGAGSGGGPLGVGGAGAGGAGAGSPGGVMPGGVGAGGGHASGRGVAGGAGTGARGGMAPGMGGAAGAGGAGAGKTGGAGQGGSSVRRAGGTVGGARGGASAANQGGTGLHRSRGGSAAGAGGRGAGLAGAPGAGSGGNSSGRRGSTRPDYLAEEEETWVPKRNVAPRVIE